MKPPRGSRSSQQQQQLNAGIRRNTANRRRVPNAKRMVDAEMARQCYTVTASSRRSQQVQAQGSGMPRELLQKVPEGSA